jgi:hypothetical protein
LIGPSRYVDFWPFRIDPVAISRGSADFRVPTGNYPRYSLE